MRRVDKPWGHELIWAHTDRYVGKVLHIDAGHRLSLQYHRQKEETLLVIKGKLALTIGPGDDQLERVVLDEGESFHVAPGTRHRMEAVTDCDLVEVSTTELDDVVRLSDDYGREGTSEA